MTVEVWFHLLNIMEEENIILQNRNLLIIKPIFLKSEKIQMSALMLDKNKSRRKLVSRHCTRPRPGWKRTRQGSSKREKIPPPPKFDVLLNSDHIIISIDCIRIWPTQRKNKDTLFFYHLGTRAIWINYNLQAWIIHKNLNKLYQTLQGVLQTITCK